MEGEKVSECQRMGQAGRKAESVEKEDRSWTLSGR